MYSNPHVLVKIELTSNPNTSLGTSYAQAEASELALFSAKLDGDSEATHKDVERAYQEVNDALALALRFVEERINEQLGKLRAEGLARVTEREVEALHGAQAQ